MRKHDEDDLPKALSVAELIKHLKKMPPQAAVWTVHDLHYGPVVEPYLETRNGRAAPRGAVCIFSLWLEPNEYNDVVWIDHRGTRRTIKRDDSGDE